MPPTRGKIHVIVCGLVVAIAAIVYVQSGVTASLHEQLDTQHASAGELAALRARRNHLASLKPSADDSARWRSDRNNLEVLRAEVATLQRQVNEAVREPPAQLQEEPQPIDPAFNKWSHAGQSTPTATLQTTLWSLTRGDVDALVGLIGFDAAARAEADQFFASLPEDLRAEYGDPEHLVAAVMAGKMIAHYESAEIVSETPSTADDIAVRVHLGLGENRTRAINLQFHREANGWRLLIPAKVIEGYRHRVIGTTSITEADSR